MNGSDNLFTVEESKRQNVVSIKVVGVGGGGVNMLNYMTREGIEGVDLVAVNTDAQSLNISLTPNKIQLGNGLGAGGDPAVAKKAAEASFDQIKESLKGADLVFVATGMGGGTGTGASSVIAQAAKENGSLTIGVCTEPFSWEGNRRKKFARTGIDSMRGECDSIIVIPNDKILAVVKKDAGMAESFALVDSVLAKAVRGVSNLVLPSGKGGINIDFADLRKVMGHKGQALMGIGNCAEGSDSAYEALKDATQSPLLDSIDINGAMGVLVNFQINPAYPLSSIQTAMQMINDMADEDADFKFGVTYDDALKTEEVRVTIVVTGRDDAVSTPANTQETPQQSQQKRKKIVFDQKTGGFVNVEEDDFEVPTYIRNSSMKKVVGGLDYDEDLSKPAYIRKQID